ncbi:hypothetical protein AAC387_Pa05g1737 [Persea americana]
MPPSLPCSSPSSSSPSLYSLLLPSQPTTPSTSPSPPTPPSPTTSSPIPPPPRRRISGQRRRRRPRYLHPLLIRHTYTYRILQRILTVSRISLPFADSPSPPSRHLPPPPGAVRRRTPCRRRWPGHTHVPCLRQAGVSRRPRGVRELRTRGGFRIVDGDGCRRFLRRCLGQVRQVFQGRYCPAYPRRRRCWGGFVYGFQGLRFPDAISGRGEDAAKWGPAGNRFFGFRRSDHTRLAQYSIMCEDV